MATASSLTGQVANGDNDNGRFSAEAAGWDSNPFVHQATDEAYKALKQLVTGLKGEPGQSTTTTNVLEIGCGTGLLSLQVARNAHSVVAIDAASGMIDVLKHKLSTNKDAPKNVKAVCVLLEDPEDKNLPPADIQNPDGPRMRFDLILSHLVLHHIPELETVLKTMLGCLKSGGQVALTDFQDFGPEAKKFHPQSKLKGVERHGINKDWMANLMKEVGFTNVDVRVGWTMQKDVERFEGEFGTKASGGPGEGEMMNFPFLVCMGTKSS